MLKIAVDKRDNSIIVMIKRPNPSYYSCISIDNVLNDHSPLFIVELNELRKLNKLERALFKARYSDIYMVNMEELYYDGSN